MNGGMLLGVLACVGFVLLVVFAFEIAVFRVACLLSRLPQPGFVRTAGMVSVLLVVPGVIDAVTYAVLQKAYRAGGYPLWEAGVVQFFVALPVHMGVCSLIHAKMVGLHVGDAVGVWFVEKLLKLFLLGAVAAVVGGILLIAQLK